MSFNKLHLFRRIRGPKTWLPIVILAVFFGGWYLGSPPATDEAASQKSDTLWTCSMHPQIRQPEPGLCPICAMDLIPLTSGSQGGFREIQITAEAAALMDLRVSPVIRQPATVNVNLFGKITYDERNVNTTNARMGGRLDRFYIDYTGTEVRKGDHIAEIYSPDLYVAQQDLIRATQRLARADENATASATQTQERLLASARERLRLLQLTDQQIDEIALQDEPSDNITLYAPQDGLVTTRHVVEGTYVKEGDPLFAVAGLDSVWLNLEAYESDLAWLRFAQDVAFTVEALPGREFHGRISYIDPEIDPKRRVARVRVNVPNEEHLLKPGMFARATVNAQVTADDDVIDNALAGKWISPMHPEIIRDDPGQCPICQMDLVPAEELGFIHVGSDKVHENPLLIPATAVLKTGKRATVYVRLSSEEGPKFEGREIVLGPRAGDQYMVESGLTEGELVVTRGAFMLDSELQIKAQPSMMNRNAGLLEKPAGEADENLLAQWSPVQRAFGRLTDAVAEEDAESVRQSISEMKAAVDQVNTESFQPDLLNYWNEFSNRLLNVLTSALNVDTSGLQMAHRDIRLAIEESGRYLGLPYHPIFVREEVPEQKLTDLREALTTYELMANALARDDLEESLSTRTTLTQHLRVLGIDDHGLGQAEDLQGFRVAFEAISEALAAQVQDYGIDRVGNVYVIHCPMAFGNQGANWLSSVPEVVNPYFGDEMLNCGSIKATLSFNPDETTHRPHPQ